MSHTWGCEGACDGLTAVELAGAAWGSSTMLDWDPEGDSDTCMTPAASTTDSYSHHRMHDTLNGICQATTSYLPQSNKAAHDTVECCQKLSAGG